MDNIFHTGRAMFYGEERSFILIPRKPSEIPVHIDKKMMHTGCCCHMDGPNNKVVYEFFTEKGFEAAKTYLIRYEWKETTRSIPSWTVTLDIEQRSYLLGMLRREQEELNERNDPDEACWRGLNADILRLLDVQEDGKR